MKYTEIREQLCDIGRRVWTKGWGASNDGNISVKVDDDLFLVTPTNVSKGMMEPYMFTLTDSTGKVIEAAEQGYRYTSEFKVHLACYRARPDIGAVVHAHPPIATAYAVAHLPLTGHYIPETMYTLGSVPVAPYAAPGTPELAKNIEPFLQEHDAVLMANHGAVTVGTDLLRAYFMMETLEFCAQLTLNTTFIGKSNKLSEAEAKEILSFRERDKDTRRHPGLKEY